jgi:hypothetical protein
MQKNRREDFLIFLLKPVKVGRQKSGAGNQLSAVSNLKSAI